MSIDGRQKGITTSLVIYSTRLLHSFVRRYCRSLGWKRRVPLVSEVHLAFSISQSIHICNRYAPNLALEIAVLIREREQDCCRGSTEGAGGA